MAILHVMADLGIQEAISFFMCRESPIGYRGTVSRHPLCGNTFSFRAAMTNITYLVSECPLDLEKEGVLDRTARDLEFRHRIKINTLNFERFPPPVIASTKEVVDYLLDRDVSCYVVLQTFKRGGNIVIGGYNPRTDKLIETKGDRIHR